MTDLRSHPDLALMQRLMPSVRKFQELAVKHGIGDIFQDNGGKLLQLVLTMDLKVSPGRSGNDATDRLGREYELKSLNIDLQAYFTTHHHLNHGVINKYRKVGWLFAMYRGMELSAIYSLEPHKLEELFKDWEQKLARPSFDHLNNPKIPAKLVMSEGALIYGEMPTQLGKAKKHALRPPPVDPFQPD